MVTTESVTEKNQLDYLLEEEAEKKLAFSINMNKHKKTVRVVKLYYLDGMTLKNISKSFRVCVERVRQLRDRGLRELSKNELLKSIYFQDYEKQKRLEVDRLDKFYKSKQEKIVEAEKKKLDEIKSLREEKRKRELEAIARENDFKKYRQLEAERWKIERKKILDEYNYNKMKTNDPIGYAITQSRIVFMSKIFYVCGNQLKGEFYSFEKACKRLCLTQQQLADIVNASEARFCYDENNDIYFERRQFEDLEKICIKVNGKD